MRTERRAVSPAVADQFAAVRRLTKALRDRASRVRYRTPVEARNVVKWADQIDVTARKMMNAARADDHEALAAAWMNIRAASVLIHAASSQVSGSPCLASFDDELIRTHSLTVANNADKHRTVEDASRLAADEQLDV